MVRAGADVICAHGGPNKGGLAGWEIKEDPMDEMMAYLRQMQKTVLAINPEIIFLAHGGPFSEPEATRVIHDQNDADGRAGAACHGAAAAGAGPLHLTPATAVAQMHLGFNLTAAAIFLWLSQHVLRLVEHLLPDDPPTGQAAITPRYLVATASATPHMVPTNAGLETTRMAEMVTRMTELTLGVLDSGKLESLRELAPLDSQLSAHLKALGR